MFYISSLILTALALPYPCPNRLANYLICVGTSWNGKLLCKAAINLTSITEKTEVFTNLI